MPTETQPEESVISDDEENPEIVGAQPVSNRVAYKTVLVAVVIGIVVLWLNVNAQCPVVSGFTQKINQFAIFNDPLPHANLKVVRGRIAQIDVVHIAQQFFVVH